MQLLTYMEDYVTLRNDRKRSVCVKLDGPPFALWERVFGPLGYTQANDTKFNFRRDGGDSYGKAGIDHSIEPT